MELQAFFKLKSGCLSATGLTSTSRVEQQWGKRSGACPKKTRLHTAIEGRERYRGSIHLIYAALPTIGMAAVRTTESETGLCKSRGRPGLRAADRDTPQGKGETMPDDYPADTRTSGSTFGKEISIMNILLRMALLGASALGLAAADAEY